MAPDVADELLSVVEAAAEALRRIDDPAASLKSTSGTWSKKEILGHMVDSAVNNHHRFVSITRFNLRAETCALPTNLMSPIFTFAPSRTLNVTVPKPPTRSRSMV